MNSHIFVLSTAEKAKNDIYAIPKYNEKITITNDPNTFIEINNQYREDCQYLHSVYYDNKIIGGFRLLRELNDDDEMGIDSILILHDFGNEQFINLFIDMVFRYLDQHYSIVRNYIINCPEINYLTNNFNSDSVSDHEESYHQSEELRNIFVDCLTNKFQDKYHYYPITYENDYRCKCIVVSKRGINNKFKTNNVCDFLLSIGLSSKDKIIIHSNHVNHDAPLRTKEKPTDIVCKRKFKVVREKNVATDHSDFKYATIKIIFDEPVTFMSRKEIGDIHMKFIVNGSDYTSKTDQLSDFSFDYRLNKLWHESPIIFAAFDIYQRLYSIYGFSYFASNEDYLNYHFDTKKSRRQSDFRITQNPYPQLCMMVNRIYSDFK
jgi:hypothetical protein